MDDNEILQAIHDLVDREHTLRRQASHGEIDRDSERKRLAGLEESLDQCWDLLRQRRARREQGQDAGSAAVRPVSEVEGYVQ